MPKTKWDNAIKNCYEIDYKEFWICSENWESTEADHSISCEPKPTEILLGGVLGDSYGPTVLILVRKVRLI